MLAVSNNGQQKTRGGKMGWNSGYTAMEAAVITIYNTGALTAETLNKIMEPYKGTDCDSGGSQNLRANDGLDVREIICKIIKPKEYQEAMRNPKLYEDFEENKELYTEDPRWEFSANEKAMDVFDSIWRDMWEIW